MQIYNASEMAEILRDVFLKQLQSTDPGDHFGAELSLKSVGINATWCNNSRCFKYFPSGN